MTTFRPVCVAAAALLLAAVFTDASLEAQNDAQSSSITAAAEETVFFRRISQLRETNNLDLAEALVKDRLQERPGDAKTEFAMGLIHVSRNRPGDAAEIQKRLASSPGAAPFASQLEKLIGSLAERQALREKIAARLQAFDAEGAVTLVRTVGSDVDRAALLSQINLYRGRFAGATLALKPLQGTPGGVEEFEQLSELTTAAESMYRTRFDRISWYLASPLGSTSCTPDQAATAAANAKFTLQEYITLVSDTFIEHPLNDWLMDVAFHASLVSAPYEQVERFGDLVLRAKGNLKIPIFDRMQRSWLVIDAVKQKLYTEIDTKHPKNDYGSDDLQISMPFSIGFADVRRIQQAANSDLAGRFMRRDSYALKMEPNRGLVPYYLFMPFIHCVYGEAAQKTITRSLGRFIMHAMAPHTPAAELVDPAQATKDWLGTFTNVTAWGGAAAELSLTVSLSKNGDRKNNFAPDTAIDRALSLRQGLDQERSRVNRIADAQQNSGDLFFDSANEQLGKMFDRINTRTLFDELTRLGGAGAESK